MEDIVAELEHLKKSFGTKDVLKDINVTLKKGENLVVLGKSGSGKSVLIKCLVGLIDPDDGKAVLFGKNISELQNHELNLLRKMLVFYFRVQHYMTL